MRLRRRITPDEKVALAMVERARVEAAEQAADVILPPDLELEELCRCVVEDTTAESAFVSVVLADSQIIKAGWNLPATVELNARQPLAYSVCSYVVAHDTPRSVSSVRDDRELRHCLADVGAYIGVPLHFKRQPIGALGALHEDGHEWTETDLFSLGAFARWVEMSVRLRSGVEPAGSPVNVRRIPGR